MLHGFLSATVTKVGQKPKQLAFMNHNLLTDAGRDWMHMSPFASPGVTTAAEG